ncbi:MAG: hypothetical protein PHO01_13265 [Desulfotomaculaceae bacterium]|nr:hypothetical protein [Desulfotomaculaceae bacterium]
MIVRINGRVLNDKVPETTSVKKDSFSWTVIKPNPKTDLEPKQQPEHTPEKELPVGAEPLRVRINRIQKSLKTYLVPVVSGINFLAAYPVSAAANQYGVATATSTTITAATTPGFGGMGIASALTPIINMLQELALPVGIAMAIWGLIEIIIGNPGGKDKIKYSILGYVGCFVIPYFFYKIGTAFQNMPLG